MFPCCISLLAGLESPDRLESDADAGSEQLYPESDQALTWQADLPRCQGSGSLVPTLKLIGLFGEALQPLPSGAVPRSGSSWPALGFYGC